MRKYRYTGYVLIANLALLLLLASCNEMQTPVALQAVQQTEFTFSDAQLQLANITVAEVKSGSLGNELLLTGVLRIDEQSVVNINAGISGRINKLFFKNTGEVVGAGMPLYEFYSEELQVLEREYKSLEDNNWNFVGKSDRTTAIENKLMLLGLLPSQLEEIKEAKYPKSVITIYSTCNGIIRSVNVSEGQYVEVGQLIYGLADDSRIWAEAQVYPNELQYLAVGMPAEVIVPGVGDLHISNSIGFINPAFEPGSNVTIVRVVIDNPGRQLYPGMHTLILVQTRKAEGIVIPSQALLIEKEGYIVWIQNENGSFSSRPVTTGIQSADSVLVLAGLEPSEQIVVSGVYLLNSEKILNSDNEQQ